VSFDFSIAHDFGRTAADYATHRIGFPPSLFERLERYDIGRAGQRVLDLGTGTGSLGRGFAKRGCVVTGLDRSTALLAEARRLDEQAGVQTTYVEASAEQTGFADRSFEVVTAGQCWHWFDGRRAAIEARRLLVPGGKLCLAAFDWVAVPGNLVDVTEALIEEHNPNWRLRRVEFLTLTAVILRELAVAGFSCFETFSYDLPVQYTHEGWRGRIRASAGVGASLAPTAIAAFDEQLAALMARDFPADPQPIPHRVAALIAH